MTKRCTFLMMLMLLMTNSDILFGQLNIKIVENTLDAFGNKEGLSQGFIPSMVQDQEGFMWFATKDGLNKFDGYHTTVYRNDLSDKYSLPENVIAYIAEDQKGYLWVSTQNKGLFVFNKQSERFIPVSLLGEQGNTIGLIKCLGGNMMTLSGSDIKLYDISHVQLNNSTTDSVRLSFRFSFNNNKKPNHIDIHSGWFFVDLFPDLSIWMAKKDTVLEFKPNPNQTAWEGLLYDANHFEMKHQNLFHFFPIHSADSVVFISNTRLSIFSRKQNRVIYKTPIDSISVQEFIYNMPCYLNSHAILIYDRKSPLLFDPEPLTFKRMLIKGNGGFSGPSRLMDRDGTIWIGTGGKGVFKYNTRRELFQHDSNEIHEAMVECDGQLYLRFLGPSFIYHSTDKSQKPIMPPQLYDKELQPPIVLGADLDHHLWLRAGSDKLKKSLLLLYHTQTHQIEDHTDWLPNDYQYNYETLKLFFTDNQHHVWNLWQLRDSLPYRFNVIDVKAKKIIAQYTLPISRNSNKSISQFYSPFQDQQGRIWFGTNDGLFQFNPSLYPSPKAWKIIRHDSKNIRSMSGNSILSLYPEGEYVWIGTNGHGLTKMELTTGECEHFTTTHGLPNNVVYAILNDDYGNLWLSTNQGLSCFNKKNKTFRNYTTEDGLPGNEYNRNQYIKTSNGTLFFGGVDGITWFHPKDILSHILPESRLVFTGFSIFNNPIQFKKDQSILQKPVNYTSEIILPYAKNIFSIEFALLQYCSTEKKRYRYWMEGFNDSWIDNGTNNTVTFTNLNPGKYIFHVKGCNSDGIWNQKGRSLTIIILAPWYQTWWFKFFVLITLAGILYALYRYRLQQQWNMLTMRNNIASDLHDEIGSTISSISVYSNILEDTLEQPDLKDIAARIHNSSSDILTVMSDIVWSINPKNDRFDSILLRMKSFAMAFSEMQKSTIHFNIHQTPNNLTLNMHKRKNMYLFFKEALINAVKYAKADNIWIDLNIVKGRLTLMINDDGIGFNTDEMSEGNGLSNLQLRANELKGKAKITSTPGEGTSIQLEFMVD